MHQITLVLIEVGALLLIMSIASRLANRLGQSPIPFYMTLGLLFGVGGFLSLEASMPFLKTGSEIGVVLLLLMLGLEFSPRELISNLKSSAPVGVWDALLNAVPGAAFGFIMGWGPLGALVMAGVTWISSSGVVSKVLTDLGRVGNRETPTVLAVLVIEDLAMAFYLPILSAVVIGASLAQGAITVAIAVGSVFLVLLVALRFGKRISRSLHREALTIVLLSLGLIIGSTMLIMFMSDAGQERILFEVVSAFATVGMSTGITASLPPAAQYILIVLMFAGRVGPVTIASALALKTRHPLYEYPKERPLIG
jgi:CPA2 family monovalent cation:H+ antiporter-2